MEHAPWRKGDRCTVVDGEHAGREGDVSAIDEDGDIYVRLTGGSRVVLPPSQLRHVTPPSTAAPVPAPRSPPLATVSANPAQTRLADGSKAILTHECADGQHAAALPEVNPAVGACLATLCEWPEGAHAAAVGLLAEVDEAAQRSMHELGSARLKFAVLDPHDRPATIP